MLLMHSQARSGGEEGRSNKGGCKKGEGDAGFTRTVGKAQTCY